MAKTLITQAYEFLHLQLPEYMDALNFCLVAGGLRTGTLVDPYQDPKCAYRPVDEKIIDQALKSFPSIRTRRYSNSNLVYHQSQQDLVNLLPLNLNHRNLTSIQSTILGKILNYPCPGQIGSSHLIRYLTLNPWTRNPNGFMGFACAALNQDLLNQILEYGRQRHTFFQENDLFFPVSVEISHVENGDFVVDYKQSF